MIYLGLDDTKLTVPILYQGVKSYEDVIENIIMKHSDIRR